MGPRAAAAQAPVADREAPWWELGLDDSPTRARPGGPSQAAAVADSRPGKRRGPTGGSETKPARATAPALPAAGGAAEAPQKATPQLREPAEVAASGSGADPAFMTTSRFDACAVSPLTLRALHEVMGYETMTVVQAATLPVILQGKLAGQPVFSVSHRSKDVLAKAKTGTGKTIAFTLPAIDLMLRTEARDAAFTRGPSPIRALVICPTRELATQCAAEARMLLTFHQGLGAQVVIGGTNMNAEANRLARDPCQARAYSIICTEANLLMCRLLVATPGRLLDHIQKTPNMRQKLQGLKVLVMDEADQLLDMGFRKTLDGILAEVPKNRQTLLFSATIPDEVHAMKAIALKKDHEFVDTVGQEETQTNVQVRQEVLFAPPEHQLATILGTLLQHIAAEPYYKVLVFSTTARLTGLLAELFAALGHNTREIHSRKSQSFRTKVSQEFRESPGGIILFTSDVSARGVDYPDVSLVLQVGVPSDREQYIHRLGRTARAGKEGHGILLLAPYERYFMKQIQDLPVAPGKEPVNVQALERKVQLALQAVQEDSKEKAYQSWLGYYNSARGLNWDKATLVAQANFFSACLGMSSPPALAKKTVGMMGLRGVPGLRVA
eukprot:SM000021S06475  [mRNA]  locus=s21:511441:515021:- [translate_table: standard]